MATLVNLDLAVAHLNQRGKVDPDRLIEIQTKLDEAEAIVLNWCNTTPHRRAITATWTEETVPLEVRGAILAQLAQSFRFRGDDPEGTETLSEWGLSPKVEGLLARHRDPVVS